MWSLGEQAIFLIIGGLPTTNPLAPTPVLHVPICFEMKLVLKWSPFLVHRTDRLTTAPYLHVPSTYGHPIFPVSDILFIKIYPEMGLSHCPISSGVIVPRGQSMP